MSDSQIGGEKENVHAAGIFGNGQLFVVVAGGGGGGGGASLVCATSVRSVEPRSVGGLGIHSSAAALVPPHHRRRCCSATNSGQTGK